VTGSAVGSKLTMKRRPKDAVPDVSSEANHMWDS
jgi:hypothetical protein